MNAPEKTSKERREYPRVSPEIPIKTRVFHNESRLEGRIKSISEGGVLIKTPKVPPVNAEVRIHFVLPPQGEIINCQARVVRVVQGVSMRLKFLSIEDSQRAAIASYVKRYFFGV